MSELKGRAEQGKRTREAIVNAAIEVFAVRGYRSGALAEIAAKVDLTPAGILYHFGTKEDLLLTVLAERDRRAGDVLTMPPVVEGLASLRSVVRVAELSEQEPGLAALYTVLQVESFEPDAPAHDYFLGRNRFVRGLVERVLRDAQKAGEVQAKVDCGLKAKELVAFLEGAAVVWLLDPSVSLAELYASYIDSFIDSIAA